MGTLGEARSAADADGRLGIFNYVTEEKAPLYRAIMRCFVAVKERFGLYLRPAEVLDELAADPQHAALTLPEVERALQQLSTRTWGNLEEHHDTAAVQTVEEYRRPRWQYQLSAKGEAAEQAIAVYEDALRQPGELQTAALSDIRTLLAALLVLAGRKELGESDEQEVALTLNNLRSRFEELTSRAQTFIRGLQRAIDLRHASLDQFLAYKQRLIEYLERFVSELVLATADVADKVAALEGAGVERLLATVARREAGEKLVNDDDAEGRARAAWTRRWQGLRAWFIGQAGSRSQAELLRERARSAIPALLRAIAAIHERRVAVSDRVKDLRTLARWFAETGSAAEAHRLWRAAFALSPARHLRVDAATLDAWEAAAASASTSWADAPPLRVSPRLHATGRYTRRGRPESVIDRSAEKRRLAEAAAREARQLAAARERLARNGRVRLSELGDLDPAAFSLLLDLLGEALARKIRRIDTVEATSSDGSLVIRMEPTGDAAVAVIRTSDGELQGDDHYVTIFDPFDETELLDGPT